MNHQPLIIIVEDDDLQYEIYEDALANYQLARACTGSAALNFLARLQPLTRRSAANASSRVGNASHQTRCTGRRAAV